MNERRESEPQTLVYAIAPRRQSRRWIIALVASPLFIILATVLLQPRGPYSRELPPEGVCAANLRGIGQALYLYAFDEPNGMFPDDVQRVLVANNATPRQFICPGASAGHQCYYYVPGHSLHDNPKSVLMLEDPQNHNGQGGNVLFLDSHVEFVKFPAYQAIMNQVAGRAR